MCAPLLSKYELHPTDSLIYHRGKRAGGKGSEREGRGKRDNGLGRCGLSWQEESVGMRGRGLRGEDKSNARRSSMLEEKESSRVMFRGVIQ